MIEVDMLVPFTDHFGENENVVSVEGFFKPEMIGTSDEWFNDGLAEVLVLKWIVVTEKGKAPVKMGLDTLEAALKGDYKSFVAQCEYESEEYEKQIYSTV